MGDIIEFTTWQKHKNIFYEITSSCINFDVKSNGAAAVGLANEPNAECFIWVIIGDGDRTCIKKIDNDYVTIKDSNILNRGEYNRFWISWAENYVTLGKSGKKQPLLRYKTKLPVLNYVTFCVVNNGPPVHWRLELPPLFKEPRFKEISKGELKWVAGETQLPDDAVVGGFDREILYIIRAEHRGSLTPGAFVPSEGCGYIPWGGQSHEKTTFEVLCGLDYMWVPTKGNKIPVKAMEAGYSEVHREPLYIGRAYYNGSVIPGKVQPSHNVCYIHCGDEEKTVENYEILIVPDRKVNSIDKLRTPHAAEDIGFARPVVYSPPSDDDNDNVSVDNYGDDYDEDEFNYPNEFI